MSTEALYSSLDYVDHSREKRHKMALHVLSNPELIAPLLEIAFEAEDRISSKACWVLEFTLKEHLSYLYPYMDYFIDNLGKLRLESSLRPAAKICELLMGRYFSQKDMDCVLSIDERQLEKIATACFDWLIGDYKVATKVHSMTSLLHLGKKFQWIHPELKMILEQDYSRGSAAYKARARHTLQQLKKYDRS